MVDRIRFKAARRVLKQEPYDPDARDGDNDGIVQERTPWERPVGTRFLQVNGKPFKQGAEANDRPAGKLVDEMGKEVDYTPTYDRDTTSRIGQTIGQRRQTVGETVPKPSSQAEAVSKPTKKNRNPVFEYYTPGADQDEAQVKKAAQRVRSELRAGVEDSVRGLSNQDLMKAKDIFNLLPSFDDLDPSRENDRRLLEEALIDHVSEDATQRLIGYVNSRRSNDLYIAVPPEAVPSILRARRLKSQFETGTSRGLFSPETRRGFEYEKMGIPRSIPEGLRPIYGFQINPDFEGDSPTQANASIHYGAVVLRLKPSVRDRTTMTNADSLDHSLFPIPVDGEVSDDRILAAVGDYDFEVGDAVLGATMAMIEDVTGEFGYGDDSGGGYGIGYSEIQVHGGVSINDIAEVIYSDSEYLVPKVNRDVIIHELDRLGIDHRGEW
jgi:hypothetical protein